MKNDSFYIIIGCTIDPIDQNYQKETYFKRGVSVSNSEYERKVFNAFKQSGLDFVFVSAPVCGTWPISSKKMIVKDFHDSENLKTVKYNCSIFCRNSSKRRSLSKKIKEIISTKPKQTTIHVVVCELHSPYIDCLKQIKKEYDNVIGTIIIPDLPKHVNAESGIKKALKNLSNKLLVSDAKKYGDSYICFTKPIEEYINEPNKPSAVLEGIMESAEVKSKEKNDRPHCLYVGKLDKRNGIDVILTAAKELPDVVFDLCGTGDIKIDDSRPLNNIVYHGFVPQSESSELMSKCDILLSPHLSNGEEYLAYSFPSKIFSYVAYKKPVITFRLPCYENTIFERALIIPKNESADAFIESIKTVIKNNFKYNEEAYELIAKNYGYEAFINIVLGFSKSK